MKVVGGDTYRRHQLLECLVEPLGVLADGRAAANVQRELSQREDVASAVTTRKKNTEDELKKKKERKRSQIIEFKRLF